MTPATIKRAVNAAWRSLEATCYANGLSFEFDRMLRQSTEVERRHRRGVAGGYRVSVDTAAKLMSMQKVSEQLASRKLPTVLDCGVVRDDIVTAWYIAEQLKRKVRLFQDKRAIRANLETVMPIDYAKDCAK